MLPVSTLYFIFSETTYNIKVPCSNFNLIHYDRTNPESFKIIFLTLLVADEFNILTFKNNEMQAYWTEVIQAVRDNNTLYCNTT